MPNTLIITVGLFLDHSHMGNAYSHFRSNSHVLSEIVW